MHAHCVTAAAAKLAANGRLILQSGTHPTTCVYFGCWMALGWSLAGWMDGWMDGWRRQGMWLSAFTFRAFTEHSQGGGRGVTDTH